MAVTVPGRLATQYTFPKWDRYEEIITAAGETEIISKKEWRDGLGAKVTTQGSNVLLNGSRVDDNGVLRIRGGVHENDFSLDILNKMFQFVHSLWDQTHRKSWNSSVTEAEQYPISTHNQEDRTAPWGFVDVQWSGGPGNDFFFEYQYTVDTDTDYITLLNFPSDIEKSTTTHSLERIKFVTKNSGTLPTATQSGNALTADTRYYTTSTGSAETFQVRRTTTSGAFDFSDAGDANGRWLATPWGLPVYLEQWTGNVTYTTCSFIVHIRGDYDQDTLAEVRFRRKGTTEWKRAANARAGRAAQLYELYQYHISGAIFRLCPNTEYEIQLTLSNPHGVYLGGTLQGTSGVTIESTFRTRPRPRYPDNGTTHYPTSTDEIRVLLGCSGAGGTKASAGDTIVIPTGNFADYGGTNELTSISIVGTELNPIHVVAEDGANGGDTHGCILPQVTHSNSSSWVYYDSVRFNNYSGNFSSPNTYAIEATGDNYGLGFFNCSLEFPDDLPTDPFVAEANGDWWDGHGGYFLGGSDGQDHKYITIEDNKIHLGSYPDMDTSGRRGTTTFPEVGGWLPNEAFDARTTAMVFGFNDLKNTYDSSFSHYSGSDGGNVVLHNEVHHNSWYACFDDWIECDHSDGGHMLYANITRHGASWGNTNLLGNVGDCEKHHFTGQWRENGEWSLTDLGVVDGHQSWEYLSTSGNHYSDFSIGMQLRQRRMQAYTVDTGTDTFTATNHGYIDDDTVTFQSVSGAGVPSGLSEETFNTGTSGTPVKPPTSNNVYYIVNATTNTFQVSASQGGSAIDITSDPGANGRYVAYSDKWYVWWCQKSYGNKTKMDISTIAADRYPEVEYFTTQAPIENASVIINQGRRASFTGYRCVSAQGETGSIPVWHFGNQHTGFPLVGAPDSPWKWKDAGASINILGNIVCNQYENRRLDEMNANGSEFFTSNIWLTESSGYYSTQYDDIATGPTSGTTSSPVLVDYLLWDRNAYWNQDSGSGKRLVGQTSIASMYTAYGIDQNGVQITVPANDLEETWDSTDVSVKSPLIGTYGNSDVGTSAAMYPKDTGQLYDKGPSEADMPGIDNVLGPYLNNTDTSNVSFLATKSNNRRDIGPHQRGLGQLPTGNRTYVDYLTFITPDDWEVKALGTDYSSIGVTTGTGTARLLIGTPDNKVAILVEYEEF